jgi:hypothetical protein
MRLKIDRNHSKQPVAGWSFNETSFGVILKEDSLDGILARIVRFRKSNMLPVGDPEHELAMQYTATHPHLVIRTESSVVRESRDILEFMEWFAKTWQTPPPMLADKAAIKERADICRKCQWNDTDFDFQAVENKARLFALSGATSEDGLSRCVIHGWHNLIGCRLRKTEKNEEQPAHCWAGEVPKL